MASVFNSLSPIIWNQFNQKQNEERIRRAMNKFKIKVIKVIRHNNTFYMLCCSLNSIQTPVGNTHSIRPNVVRCVISHIIVPAQFSCRISRMHAVDFNQFFWTFLLKIIFSSHKKKYTRLTRTYCWVCMKNRKFSGKAKVWKMIIKKKSHYLQRIW